jgi:hypothetical protein
MFDVQSFLGVTQFCEGISDKKARNFAFETKNSL